MHLSLSARTQRARRAMIAIFALLAALLVALPASASAATFVNVLDLGGSAGDEVLSVTNSELITPAQRIRVTVAEGLVIVRDESGARVRAGRLCRDVGGASDRAVCPLADTRDGRIERITAAMGPGDDRFVNATAIAASIDGQGEDDALTGRSVRDVLNGGPGDDALAGAAGDDLLDGDPGDDALKGGLGADLLRGEEGNDELFGELGRDRLHGESGIDTLAGGGDDDFLDGGVAPDVMRGGDGVDAVDYSILARGTGVSVSLDGIRNDGGEADRLGSLTDLAGADVENVTGSPGNDLLVGSAADNTLTGGAGDDILQAAAGDDRLLSDPGDDTLAGGPGIDTASYRDHPDGVGVTLDDFADDGSTGEGDDVRSDTENVEGSTHSDRIIGSPGPNRLDGRDGIDIIDGRAGQDTLSGGLGDDRQILAQDGEVDTVSCGPGRDAAALDLRDVPTPVTEIRDRQEVEIAPSDCEFALELPFGERPILRLRALRSRLDDGVARVRLTCAKHAPRPCRGRLLADRLDRNRARRVDDNAIILRAGHRRRFTLRVGRRPGRIRISARILGPTGRPHIASLILSR